MSASILGLGLRSVGLGVAGVLASGVLAAAADDSTIQRRIEARLVRARIQGQADVAVAEGRAVLTGTVASVHAKNAAERAARKEAREVVSRLQVVPAPRPDAAIRRDAVRAVLADTRDSVFDSIELGVRDGVVLLSGSVYWGYRKAEIEDRVSRVPGVREIRNEIEVQPTSSFDDRLRLALYRAIYGDLRFVQYAHRATPPIRIVVMHGHVTLSGAVASPVEQALIGHIARGLPAFSVENRLTVDGQAPGEAERSSDTSG